jgi:TRAP-type C4-dicarboxylate transport system permease large subunit
MEKMTRDLMPLLGAELVVLLLLTLVPAFSTWLPGLFGYSR